jgi:hypothetical protein
MKNRRISSMVELGVDNSTQKVVSHHSTLNDITLLKRLQLFSIAFCNDISRDLAVGAIQIKFKMAHVQVFVLLRTFEVSTKKTEK